MKRLPGKWLRLAPDDRGRLLQAALLVLAVRLGLRLLPLGALRRALDWSADRLPARAGDLGRCLWAVTAASGRTSRPCLAQALAAGWHCRRRGLPAELCIGVRREPGGGLIAHAWLESGGRVLVGGTDGELAQYTRLPGAGRGLR
jgi:hypothetical protein